MALETDNSLSSQRDSLLEGLGAAVRQRRLSVGASLRELAAVGHVSQRFLVQLEGGAANISVAKLEQVARALGTSASQLLADAERSAAGSRTAPSERTGVIALLGLRGAGKSTIGARAAERLGVAFFELDALVEQRAGMSRGALFEMHGTEFYRQVERETLRAFLAGGVPCVLATGGGIVTEHETFELLRRSARTIWLKATPQEHLARVVAQGDARPMANHPNAMSDLETLLRARRPLYERADVVVDTSALGLDRSVREVVRAARRGERPT